MKKLLNAIKDFFSKKKKLNETESSQISETPEIKNNEKKDDGLMEELLGFE
ncbi:MAG: hypothetical protein Q7S21_01715 [archaeon]|nr:hypothetical protein [archaeon]